MMNINIHPLAAAESNSAGSKTTHAEVIEQLSKPSGQKSLPTFLLYDERGLELYDDITTKVGEYYLFPCEENILAEKSDDIVRLMRGGAGGSDSKAIVLELGAGSLRKTSHLLRALANSVGDSSSENASAMITSSSESSPISYFALDLVRNSLQSTLSSTDALMGDELESKVSISGLCGSYDQGLHFVREGKLAALVNGMQRPELGFERISSSLVAHSDLGVGEAAETADDAESITTGTGTESSASAGESSTLSTPSLTSRSASPAIVETNSTSSQEQVQDTHFESSKTKDDKTSLAHLESSLPQDRINVTRGGSGKKTNDAPLHILFLGSSLGNFSHSAASDFLASLPLRSSLGKVGGGDTLLLGLDGRNEKTVIEKAYNDEKGVTREFIMNGLRVANGVLGLSGFGKGEGDQPKGFEEGKWEYFARYDEHKGRHEAYYRSTCDQTIVIPSNSSEESDKSLSFEEDELVHVEYSYKFSTSDATTLFKDSNLRPIRRWQDPQERYSVWLLERPPFAFPSPLDTLNTTTPSPANAPSLPVDASPEQIASVELFKMQQGGFSIPTRAEWGQMWTAWDTITLGMIPQEMLHTKPIDLRHKCLFYLGHIPAFLDIHLSSALKEPHTEPVYFKNLFERGIDPHVDDPTQCHPHSEVPESDSEWPSLEEILSFRDRVRNRLMNLYTQLESGERIFNKKLGRVIWMVYEHEGWHAETLLYMLLQKAGEEGGTLPPPGVTPPWALPSTSSSTVSSAPTKHDIPSLESLTVILGPETVPLGHDDIEADDTLVPPQGNEHGKLKKWEFGWDNESPSRVVQVKKFRISKKCVTNSEYKKFMDDEKNKGKERAMPKSWISRNDQYYVRTLYGPVSFDIAGDWPFISSYDDLSSYATVQGGRLPTEAELRLFMDRFLGGEGSSWGWKQWHFTEAVEGGGEGGEKGHNGGVWEWTSTLFDKQEGFAPSTLYPGYSADFFDESHQVVLGGSFSTIPRIGQRRSARNYYQHNYPFAWIGGRIAYDVEEA